MLQLVGQARRAFSLTIKKPRHSIDECIERVVDLVAPQTSGGVALGEFHGEYAHARFVRRALPRLAESGVRTIYIELFQQSMQNMLDEWQTTGDGAEIKRLFNKGFALANARDQWVHTWKIMNTARENGIRVMALEPNSIYASYIGLSLMERNYAWMQHINKSQADFPGAYVIYCGHGHLTTRNIHRAPPVTEMLDIPAVMLRRGLSSYHESPGERNLFYCWLPMSQDQTLITYARIQPPKLVH